LGQLKADVYFLARNNIIDYSLFIGIHQLREEDEQHLMGLSSLTYNSYFANGICTVISHAEIYFIQIVDILTTYDANVANSAKFIIYTQDELSTVNAQFYGERFLNFVSSFII